MITTKRSEREVFTESKSERLIDPKTVGAELDETDIPSDFLKGQKPISQKDIGPIIPLDLAFTIQDPCDNTAIALAREILTLIRNREDDNICQSLIHEIQRLNKLYPR